MCIVSFVIDENKAIVTFNRDENRHRLTEKVAWYKGEMHNYFCPIDKVGQGTWIGTNRKIVATLQNGGLKKHTRTLPYRLSRGLILKKILETNDIESYLNKNYLYNVEPFTISILKIENKEFSIYRFDGENMAIEKKNLINTSIICSSTLYNENAIENIRIEFDKIEKKTAANLFNFNEEFSIGKAKNNYTNLAETVSITQFIIEETKITYTNFDPINSTKESYEI